MKPLMLILLSPLILVGVLIALLVAGAVWCLCLAFPEYVAAFIGHGSGRGN